MPPSLPDSGSPTAHARAAGAWASWPTPHQTELLRYIREFQYKMRYSPTLSDLALAYGQRSKNAVWKKLKKLQEQGLIERNHRGEILFPPEMLDPAYTP